MSKIIVTIVLALIANISFAKNSQNHSLTIFAENDISIPLVKIIRQYSIDQNVTVSANFDSSANLIQDIDNGEPAGIFISSHTNWTTILRNKGLVDYRKSLHFAKSKLVLVTSKENNKFDFIEIAKNKNINEILYFINQKKFPIIFDSKKTSLGLYSFDILQKSNLNDEYLYEKIEEDNKSISKILEENSKYFTIIPKNLVDNNMQIIKEIEIDMVHQILIIADKEMKEGKKFLNYIKNSPYAKIKF